MFGTSLRRSFAIGRGRQFIRKNTSKPASVLNVSKKKKFSELTPQEIEAEMRENLVLLRKSFENYENQDCIVPIFKKTLLHADNKAVKDCHGEYTYIQLYVSAKRLAIQISNICSSGALRNIGYLCANNVLSPLVQWACWISGQVAMPLNMFNSCELLKSLLQDSKASILIVSPEYEQIGSDLTAALDIPLMVIDHSFMVAPETTLLTVPRVIISSLDTVIVEGTCSNDFYTMANAVLFYTMGTTGKPKGVMLSHKNLDTQVKSLVKAWKYNAKDCVMHALPYQHGYWFASTIMCPFNVGGRVIMNDQFDNTQIWSTLLGINTPAKERVNVFMAVPAVYNVLIAEYEKAISKNDKVIDYISKYCRKRVRLMVSGGSPIPQTISRRWREITGHNIVECYGTTEMGLALSSQPFAEKNEQTNDTCQQGCIGMPLPDVRVRLVDSKKNVLVNCIGQYNNDRWTTEFLDTKEGNEIQDTSISNDNDGNYSMRGMFSKIANKFSSYFDKSEKSFEKNSTTEEVSISDNEKTLGKENLIIGELQISEENIFESYYNNSNATNNAFHGNFFKTGDIASFQDGGFKILGCINVDVIAVGSNNLSNYDIESRILEHPNIRDASVIVMPSKNDENQINTASESGSIMNSSQKQLGVVCVLKHKGTQLDLDALNIFCSKSIPKYLLPTQLKIVDELPRTNMIEINRKALLQLFENDNLDPKNNKK